MSSTPADRVDLAPGVLQDLQAALPAIAERTIQAVTSGVAEYRQALSTEMGAEMSGNIQGAVELALGALLRIAADDSSDATASLDRAHEGAYALGRGEALAGRSMEALLGAYRVGARLAWQEISELLVRRQVPAGAVARFALLVFTYIDELSGASVAGHGDQLATSGRVHEQLLERLATGLLVGETSDQLLGRAERAGWVIPETITVVVLRSAHLANAAQLLDPRTLRLAGDLAPHLATDDLLVLLVPDAHRSRTALLNSLVGRGAIVGPTRPWDEAAVSYQRARRSLEQSLIPDGEPIDTDAHLVELVLTADIEALDDLRTRALQPLAGVRPAVADRLTETLRSWLLHQGRRADVAADLNIHAQTVRYRMTQVREIFGDRLTHPASALELTIALALPGSTEAPEVHEGSSG